MDFTFEMDAKEKLIVRNKLGLSIQKILAENKSKNDKNLITSLRKLAAASGVEYAIIQRISSGKKDPQWTTIVAIADGLGLTVTDMCGYYEHISETSAQKQIQANKARKKKG